MTSASPVVAAAAGEQANGRVAYEVADVVRAYGEAFVRTHPTSAQQRGVLRAIANCRTAVLGGHVEGCDACGHRRISYNSCRNRHCPKCQGKERAKWMAAEQAMLLPVPYFHVVFTLPHRLNALLRVNRRRLCDLLFRVAASTLRSFALDPSHLGAEPAITMVLHTWGQTLTEHFHVHCVISGGGLSLDGQSWIGLPKGKTKRRRPFLFPVAALSKVFRGKYIAALKRMRNKGELRFAGHSESLADGTQWQELLDCLAATDWVVYCKPPFGGPEQVLKYLSRYTHRVAISNQRLLFVGDGVVRFAWKDYADHNAHKEMTLPAAEFLRRFLLHMVPRGFMRIRHYSILANCRRQQKLARCRALLGVAAVPASEDLTEHDNDASTQSSADDNTERALGLCPICGGSMRMVERLAPQPHDTS